VFFTLIGVVHPRQLGGSITVSAAPLPDIPKLREQLDEHSAQIKTLQEQITQSESNLAAQKEVTEAQVQSAVAEAIQGAKREHLELLAGDTGMDLDEMDTGKQLFFQIGHKLAKNMFLATNFFFWPTPSEIGQF